ncbi:MAG: hypothetical protein WC867_08630 [Candidatus Pacearchaeota archaeon]|jgi:hypothetical protein
MGDDYSNEVKELIERYKKKGFRYAKPLDFLLDRIGDKKENIETELINLENIKFCEKQQRNGEIRYSIYFVYSNKKGRVYVVTFEDKIVVITIFPIGKTTLKKYKKRFIR